MATPAVDPAPLPETVSRVFRKVWDEFYEWHADRCKLSHLGSPSPVQPDADLLWARDLILGYKEELPPAEQETIDIVVDGGFDESPPYESCTPLGRSVFVGDDPTPIPFAPFADDPTFDHQEYLSDFDEFKWQTATPDPNVEFITLETAARLQENHGMSMQTIDATKVLPWRLLPHAGDSGLLHRGSQRDFPPWNKPTPSRLYSRPENSRVPAPNDLYARVESMHRIFCPNLNCVRAACSLHPTPRPMRALEGIRYENHEFSKAVEKPCGSTCFLLDTRRDRNSIDWSARDVDDLRDILRIEPDGIPCDLAIVMRKPCREVLRMRQLCLPTVPPNPKSRRKKGRPPLKRSLKFRDANNPDLFTPNEGCAHLGPCDASTQCPCWRNQLHCERNCHCPYDGCKRRWRGCRCRATSANWVVCGTHRCPCWIAQRECSPELCGPCGARDPNARLCANVAIQRAAQKSLEVRAGRWGFGLVILERAHAGSFICEYVGEVVSEDTVETRDILAAHRGRNYVFGLNETTSIDGSAAGNVARYINHATGDRANCSAHVWYVNGDHRIGVFAERDLAQDEELLMDYGEAFFRVPSESVQEEEPDPEDDSDYENEGSMDVDD